MQSTRGRSVERGHQAPVQVRLSWTVRIEQPQRGLRGSGGCSGWASCSYSVARSTDGWETARNRASRAAPGVSGPDAPEHSRSGTATSERRSGRPTGHAKRYRVFRTAGFSAHGYFFTFAVS